MSSLNIAILAVILYALVLFLVAFISDRRDRPRWLGSPIVYTLSISVYCTSWTFYGAVGSAARNGLEFATIYIGPTLVFLGFYTILRKLLHIRRKHNITSIADLISSRYGKSDLVAALVTLIALAGAAPYIALQLKAITTSFEVMSAASVADFSGSTAAGTDAFTAFWVAAGLALFTILFGTRSIDANERHYGVVAAIAVEAVVKLVALIGVGLVAVYHVADGPQDIFERISQTMPPPEDGFGVRWIGLILLSGMAVLCLPRQFQVTVVENNDERHLYTAAWLFPLYLFLMSLFILPIAAVGATTLPAGSNPDMYVLTMPIAAERSDVALLAFLGGFSSATSMVIVSCIALSTMISNHIVMPVVLRTSGMSSSRMDLRGLLLKSRRIAICAILLVGFMYLQYGPEAAGLASIGLVAFAGVAQVMPALLGALFWPRANRRGALLGLGCGFAIWIYTLLLPGLLIDNAWWQRVEELGLFGVSGLRPSALFGLESADPLMHALFWSLGLNTLAFVFGSLSRDLSPLEQLQSNLFVDVYRSTNESTEPRLGGRNASADALFDLAQRVMGANSAYDIFRTYARAHGSKTEFPVPDNEFINHLERRMAASVGAASARAMISRVAGGERIGIDDLVQIADETARLMEYSTRIEQKSQELEETANKLKEANKRLVELDTQKDEFLSQVSHELRTPMTSIRSFSNILAETENYDEESKEFISIIYRESIRLTHLLDEILDVGVIERGSEITIIQIDPIVSLNHATDACRGLAKSLNVEISDQYDRTPVSILADEDRLTQVFINIISNAMKYNNSQKPTVEISTSTTSEEFRVVISDNGPGVAHADAKRIFEKFSRGDNATGERGAGLGLAISRAIIEQFGGEITLLDDKNDGASFQITLPRATSEPHLLTKRVEMVE